MEKRDFNREAAKWDEDPGRVKLANDIADTLIAQVNPTPGMEVLDFGCGTGLVTLRLAPLVRSVTGVDSSTGMLDVLKAKIERNDIRNVQLQKVDLDKGDILEGSYDLVVSSMTLHHVPEITPLLKRFTAVIAPGGQLCIADLDHDNGQFHSDNKGVFHYGFDRERLRAAFIEVGLDDVKVHTAAEVFKPTEAGTPRKFTVFLIIGVRRKV